MFSIPVSLLSYSKQQIYVSFLLNKFGGNFFVVVFFIGLKFVVSDVVVSCISIIKFVCVKRLVKKSKIHNEANIFPLIDGFMQTNVTCQSEHLIININKHFLFLNIKLEII